MKKPLLVFVTAFLITACSGGQESSIEQKKMIEKTGKIEVDGKYINKNQKKADEVTKPAPIESETPAVK